VRAAIAKRTDLRYGGFRFATPTLQAVSKRGPFLYKSIFCLLCVVVCVLSTLFGLIAWMTPATGPEATFRWSVRIGTAVLGPLSLLVLFLFALKPDPVPDLFAKISGPHFGRDGVLFAFKIAPRDGICWLTIHYQNRFANRANMVVLVQPSQNFLLSRNDIPSVIVEIPCGPAAYGVVSVAMGIHRQYQGKKQLFDVGANIQYPDGTGELLRNRVGAPISLADIPGFGSLVLTGVQIAATGTPPLTLKSPSRVPFHLPIGVQESDDGLPELEHEQPWVLPADFNASESV